MMRRFIGAGLLAATLLTGAGAAHAQDNAAARSQVEELLGAFEVAPAASDWTRLGPDAAPVLREIAQDPKRRPTVRSRAVTALRYFADAPTLTLLETLLRNEQEPLLVRRKAVRVLAEGWGAQALPLISPLVEHEEPQLRESALRALGLIPGPEARTLLEARLRLEPRVYLRETIQQVLRAAPVELKPVDPKTIEPKPAIKLAPAQGAEGGAP